MNKNTLALLKNELKEYEGALSVFEMKEQQLKEAVQLAEQSVIRLNSEIEATNSVVYNWSAVINDQQVDLKQLVKLNAVKTRYKEVAGTTIEVFEEILFEKTEIDFFNTPLWVDSAEGVLIDQKTRSVMLDIEQRNMEALLEELAEARRMKNALKEVFIPETSQQIRKIEIYLGDVERLAIGCAKLVKKKKELKKMNS
ncbi:MAG: V-type ATP synthase subunit D [Bacteroidota bacterium]